MIVHLSARGHKDGVVKGDCGIELVSLSSGDVIMIGKPSDWKGDMPTFCIECVKRGKRVPVEERAK